MGGGEWLGETLDARRLRACGAHPLQPPLEEGVAKAPAERANQILWEACLHAKGGGYKAQEPSRAGSLPQVLLLEEVLRHPLQGEGRGAVPATPARELFRGSLTYQQRYAPLTRVSQKPLPKEQTGFCGKHACTRMKLAQGVSRQFASRLAPTSSAAERDFVAPSLRGKILVHRGLAGNR